MKKPYLLCILLTSVLCGCTPAAGPLRVDVSNVTALTRKGEMVELSVAELYARLRIKSTAHLLVCDKDGAEVPSQLTHDGRFIFPVTVSGRATASYFITEDADRLPVLKQVAGRIVSNDKAQYVEWGNEQLAFRAFGVDNRSGEDVGYDLLVKRISPDDPSGLPFESDFYPVGQSLGCGAAALLTDQKMLNYPMNWENYEILDNGPLRFSALFRQRVQQIAGEAVTEQRLVTLDAGNPFFRVSVNYDGLTTATPLVVGLAVSPQSHVYEVNQAAGYIAYAWPLADALDASCGYLFTGCVLTEGVTEMGTMPMSPQEKTLRGASGYVFASTAYLPHTWTTYYVGGSWSCSGIQSMPAWTQYLGHLSERIRRPLLVKLR